MDMYEQMLIHGERTGNYPNCTRSEYMRDERAKAIRRVRDGYYFAQRDRIVFLTPQGRNAGYANKCKKCGRWTPQPTGLSLNKIMALRCQCMKGVTA